MTYYKKQIKKNKSYYQRIHAKKRLKNRFKDIPVSTIETWEKMIRSFDKGVRFIQRQSNRITIHDITFKGRVIRCVYDSKRKNIVTVLQPEMEVK